MVDAQQVYVISGSNTATLEDKSVLLTIKNINPANVAKCEWIVQPNLLKRTKGFNKCEITELKIGTYKIKAKIYFNDDATHIESTKPFKLNVIDNKIAKASDNKSFNKKQIRPTNSNDGSINTLPEVQLEVDSIVIQLPINYISVRSKSNDKKNEILTHHWQKIKGPQGGDIFNPESENIVITNLVAGQYIYKFSVSDSKGLSNYKELYLSVLPKKNQKPSVVIVGPDNAKDTDTPFFFAAQALDKDGEIKKIDWQLADGQKFISVGDGSSKLVISDAKPGLYKIKVTVTDNDGLTEMAFHSFTVIKTPDNSPPVVQILSNSTSLTLPVSETYLSSMASDSDGEVVSYLWEQTSGPVCQFSVNSMPSLHVEKLSVGTFTFKLTVTDNKGAIASSTLSLEVRAKAKLPRFKHNYINLGAVSSAYVMNSSVSIFSVPYNVFVNFAHDNSKANIGWYLKGKFSISPQVASFSTDGETIKENQLGSIGSSYFLFNGKTNEIRYGATGGLLIGRGSFKVFVGVGWGKRDLNWGLNEVGVTTTSTNALDLWAKNYRLSYEGLEVEAGLLIRISRFNLTGGTSSITRLKKTEGLKDDSKPFSYFDIHAGIGFNLKSK